MDSAPRGLFVALTGVLLGVGVLMVFSASMSSRPGDSELRYIVRHLAFLGVAVGGGLVAAQLSAEQWRRLAPLLLGATVLLLVLVLIPGLGVRVNGARRWFRFAGLSLQPSELAKLTLPVYLATILERQRSRGASFGSDLRWLLGPLGVVTLLVLLEPDLGTAALVLATGVTLLWAGGWPIGRIIRAACLASPSLLGLFLLKPYQWQRISGFVDAWTSPERAPYQIKQSLLTLGVGGWSGEGLGQGWQKLSFLPEANTDFVFSVIGEELGLSGTLAVVAAWVGLYLVGTRILNELPPRSFEHTIGFTWLTMLVFQAALNIAVVTALVPPKGVSHPLISYGGTSLLVSVTILGAFLGITRFSTNRAESYFSATRSGTGVVEHMSRQAIS